MYFALTYIRLSFLVMKMEQFLHGTNQVHKYEYEGEVSWQ
jgi:hypothetical protein